jgi:hypothetical protein
VRVAVSPTDSSRACLQLSRWDSQARSLIPLSDSGPLVTAAAAGAGGATMTVISLFVIILNNKWQLLLLPQLSFVLLCFMLFADFFLQISEQCHAQVLAWLCFIQKATWIEILVSRTLRRRAGGDLNSDFNQESSASVTDWEICR